MKNRPFKKVELVNKTDLSDFNMDKFLKTTKELYPETIFALMVPEAESPGIYSYSLALYAHMEGSVLISFGEDKPKRSEILKEIKKVNPHLIFEAMYEVDPFDYFDHIDAVYMSLQNRVLACLDFNCFPKPITHIKLLENESNE